ncbi:MAG: DNA mismatch repair endonuclease MutL [Leptolyngbya foveolarum]|uniref:DNA mismatch repair endonuclease MutL n=1 Tax=Leptolyngbya foveolarum TaxID=47253 RepID=A0A2W4TYV9_9CYAN|nr:MAG: DNA mismatch repair endonuclease MutL [Leptolyngbya foveolarum]
MAAGEVIDSLAAVVRELVENALDAKATRISVGLWPERWQVRVADNGEGMTLSDLKQAAIAHATSKISTRPDLLNVRSLGFRGEALHSIAQLAELEICSRAGSAPGHWVGYSTNGEPGEISERAIAPGSIVTATNLFTNWPARRLVPSVAQQIKAVAQFLQKMALCHPQITWQIEKDNAPWLVLWPGETAKTLLPQILRNTHETDFKEISAEGLYLAIGLPDRCHRRRPDWIRIAINGRPVEVSALFQTLIQSFRRTLPRDRYPVCFLHLTLPPTQLDWNRHPAKSEIYVQQMDKLSDRVSAAVAQLLQIDDIRETAQVHRASELIKAAEFKAAEQSGDYTVSRQVQPDFVSSPVVNLSDSLPSGSVPGALRAIAQVHNTYILAEHEGGLCLIEQHIAHERVLYEQLQQRWEMVAVEPPIVLERLSEQQVERLAEVGCAIAPFGDDLWAVRTLPEPLKDSSERTEALYELSLGANLEAALVATACRTAIRNGTSLSQPEMQTLVTNWQRTQSPRTCPHGRPICLTLSETSLAKYFRRSWVIGKSHGV